MSTIDETQTIYLYAQHASMAGQLATEPDGESDDIFELTGTRGDLLDFAMHSAAKTQAYDWRVARSILYDLDFADDVIRRKLEELGASEDEQLWAFAAEGFDLLRLAKGNWANWLPAIRQEMAMEREAR